MWLGHLESERGLNGTRSETELHPVLLRNNFSGWGAPLNSQLIGSANDRCISPRDPYLEHLLELSGGAGWGWGSCVLSPANSPPQTNGVRTTGESDGGGSKHAYPVCN